jgi:hypothetical protein
MSTVVPRVPLGRRRRPRRTAHRKLIAGPRSIRSPNLLTPVALTQSAQLGERRAKIDQRNGEVRQVPSWVGCGQPPADLDGFLLGCQSVVRAA